MQKPLNKLGTVYHQLERVLEENHFLNKNFRMFDSLTRREKEIMRLISQGYTSHQIAEQLFTTTHTVTTHRKHIWHKLGMKSYTELIKFAKHFDQL